MRREIALDSEKDSQYKDRLLSVQRRSNWIAFYPVVSCSICKEFIHEALHRRDMAIKGLKTVEDAVLADCLLVTGDFIENQLDEYWKILRHPKKLIFIGNCSVKRAEKIAKFATADIISGCPVDIDELVTILTL